MNLITVGIGGLEVSDDRGSVIITHGAMEAVNLSLRAAASPVGTTSSVNCFTPCP